MQYSEIKAILARVEKCGVCWLICFEPRVLQIIHKGKLRRRRQPQSLESEGQFDYKMSRPSHRVDAARLKCAADAATCTLQQNARAVVYFGTKLTPAPSLLL